MHRRKSHKWFTHWHGSGCNFAMEIAILIQLEIIFIETSASLFDICYFDPNDLIEWLRHCKWAYKLDAAVWMGSCVFFWVWVSVEMTISNSTVAIGPQQIFLIHNLPRQNKYTTHCVFNIGNDWSNENKQKTHSSSSANEAKSIFRNRMLCVDVWYAENEQKPISQLLFV